MLKRLVLGLAFPLVVQAILAFPISWLERRATWDFVSPITLACFLGTSASAFWMMTRGSSRKTKVVASIGYFPSMFVLMFLESLYVDAHFFKNNF